MGRLSLVAALAASCAIVQPALAQSEEVVNLPISARNSFRLGDAGVLCTAQVKPTDERLKGMFDEQVVHRVARNVDEHLDHGVGVEQVGYTRLFRCP